MRRVFDCLLRAILSEGLTRQAWRRCLNRRNYGPHRLQCDMNRHGRDERARQVGAGSGRDTSTGTDGKRRRRRLAMLPASNRPVGRYPMGRILTREHHGSFLDLQA